MNITYLTTINDMWTVDTPEQGFVVNVHVYCVWN
jgi:hypothetical protein